MASRFGAKHLVRGGNKTPEGGWPGTWKPFLAPKFSTNEIYFYSIQQIISTFHTFLFGLLIDR